MITRIAVAEDNFHLGKVIEEKLFFYDIYKVKFIAENGKELLEKLEENHNVDLILMDIEMPEMNGILATTLVKNKYPQIKILMLTVLDNDENIFNAIKSGADGYLLKDIPHQELHRSIEETLQGGAAMSPSIAAKTLKLLRNPLPEQEIQNAEEVALSEREIDVLEQLCKGLNYTRIAENLYLSPNTVRKHIENIYKKLQVHNKLEAVEKAKKSRII